MFTKKDLQNGDVILRANGEVSIFIENLEMFVTPNGWMPLYKVCDDLTHCYNNHEWDIVKVRRPHSQCQCQFNAFVHDWGELVYDRERDTKPLYNGKVVCIDLNGKNYNLYTVGKIYEFKDGQLTANNGLKYPQSSLHNVSSATIHNFKDWDNWTTSKFIEIVE